VTGEISGSLIEQPKSGRLSLAVLFDDGQLGGFEAVPLVEGDLRYLCRADSMSQPQQASITLGAALALTKLVEINSIAILKSALLADMDATLLPLRAEVDSGLLAAIPVEAFPPAQGRAAFRQRQKTCRVISVLVPRGHECPRGRSR
jgi:LysR family nitrogen assimilation transcriptional regulator